jgi:hypothetical protein
LRSCRIQFALALALLAGLASARANPERRIPRFAVVRWKGDLDARRTLDELLDAIGSAARAGPSFVLLEVSGDRARPDLLHDMLEALGTIETPLGVWLRDPRDARVGVAQAAIALAADHAAIAPGTRLVRAPGEDLTALNPEIKDWSVIGLDLRHRAREIAARRALPESWVEALLAPRAEMWYFEDEHGAPRLEADAPAHARRVVERTPEGWSVSLGDAEAARLFALSTHRNERTFLDQLGARGRPLSTATVESGLARAHERCLFLVEQARAASRSADAALDVRARRRGAETITPQHYHRAADEAAAIVAGSRAAIAEIQKLTTDYPELLWMKAPPDARAPTEIGGPSRTTLASWRAAVRDAESDLSRLDDRIADFRRR